MEQFSYTLPVEFSTNFAQKVASTGDSLFFIIALMLLAMATVFGFAWFRLCRANKASSFSAKCSVGSLALSGKLKIISIVSLVCAILLLCSSAILFCKTAFASAQQEQFEKTKIVVALDEATGQYTIQNTQLKNVYPYIQLDTSSCEITPEASSVASLKNVGINLSSKLAKGSFYNGKADGSEYVPQDLSVVKLDDVIDLNLTLENLSVQDALQLDGKTVFNIKLNNSFWEIFPYAEFNSETGQLVFYYDDNYSASKNQFIVPIQISGPDDLPWLTEMDPLLIKSVKFDDVYSEKPILISLSNYFNGCENLETVDLTNLNSEKLTNCESTFEGCTNLEKILTKNKDFNKTITESENMFKGCDSLVGGNGSKLSDPIFEGRTDATIAQADYEGHPGIFTYDNKEDMSHITYNWNFKSGTQPKIDTEHNIPLNEKFKIIVKDPDVDVKESNKGYTFKGWALTKEAKEAEYSFGSSVKAEKPEIIVYAVWNANSDTPYTVKHYKQNLDGTYNDDPEDDKPDFVDKLNGTTDTEVTPETKPTATEDTDNFYGFTAPEKQTVTIKGDGSTVVNYYYERNHYYVNFVVNNDRYAGTDIQGVSLLYEGLIDEDTRDSLGIKAGQFRVYGYGFLGWYKSGKEEPAKPEDLWDFEKDTVLHNTTLTAKWELYNYTVEAKLNANDAAWGVESPTTSFTYNVTQGDVSIQDKSLTVPKRPVYEFQYWSSSSQDGEEFTTINSTTLNDLGLIWDNPSITLSLFATWKLSTFTIDFYNVEPSGLSNSTERVDMRTITYGDSGINTSDIDITKSYDGYTLTGWFPETGGTKITQVNTSNLTSLGCNLNDTSIHGKIYTHWDPNTYTINADICDGQYKEFDPDVPASDPITSIQYVLNGAGANTSLLTKPYIAGYTFDGWYTKKYDGVKIEKVDYNNLEDVGCDISKPVQKGTLFAHFTPNTYTIDVKEETPGQHSLYANNEPKTITYTTGTDTDVASIEEPEPPSGFAFTGWYDKANKGTQATLINLNNIEMFGCKIDDPSIHGTIYGQWKSTKYTVNFKAYPNDGTCKYSTDSQVFTRGETQQLNDNNFYCADCSFAGWSTTPGSEVIYKNCEEVIDIAEPDKGSINLYPKWAQTTYNVEFNANGGSGSMGTIDNLSYHNEVKLSRNTFKREGYEFDGWTNKTDGDVLYSDEETVKYLEQQNEGVATLYAHWRPINYYVAFHANSGNGEMPNQEFTYDVQQKLSKGTFTISGKHLVGWAESPESTDVKYYDEAEITTNLTSDKDAVVDLYAIYEINKYTVEFVPNGAKWTDKDPTLHSQTLEYGKRLTLPKKPVDVEYKNPITDRKSYTYIKDGYLFDGWSTEASGSVKYSDGDSVINLSEEHNATVTLYAHWTKAEPLIFDYDSSITEGAEKTYWYHPLVDDSVGLSGVTFYQANGVEIPKTNNNGTAYSMDDLRYATQYVGASYFKAFREYNISFSDAFGPVGAGGYAESWTGSGHYKPNEDTCETLNLCFKGKTTEAQNASIANIDIDKILSSYFKNDTNEEYNFYGRYAHEAGKGVTLSFDSATSETSDKWQYNSGLTTALVLFSRHFNQSDTKFNGTVKFDSNMGDGTSQSQTFTNPIVKFDKNTFVNPGHTFTGWSLSPNGQNTFSDEESVYSPFFISGQTVTLYACWEAHTYKVQFYTSDGGTIKYTQSLTYGVEEKLSDVNHGAKTGYNHDGWSTKINPSEKEYDKQQSVKNLTEQKDGIVNLYAYYRPITFTIQFFNSSGTVLDKMPTQQMVYDSKSPLNEHVGEKVGYTFEGWSTSKGDSKVYDDKSTECSKLSRTEGVTVNLYEVYKPVQYTLKFDYNGVEDTYDQLKSKEEDSPTKPYLPTCEKTLAYDQETTLPSMNKQWLAFEDQFLGWTLDPNKTTPDYVGGTKVKNLSSSNSDTVTLYACWKHIPSLFADKAGTDDYYPAGGWIKYIDHMNNIDNNSYYSSFLYRPLIGAETQLKYPDITFYTLQQNKPTSYTNTGWSDTATYDNYTVIEPANKDYYTMDDLKCAVNYSGSVPFKAMRVVSCPEYESSGYTQGHWWYQYENVSGVGGLDLEKPLDARNKHYHGVFKCTNGNYMEEICENIQFSQSGDEKIGVFNQQAAAHEHLHVFDAAGRNVYLYPNPSLEVNAMNLW